MEAIAKGGMQVDMGHGEEFWSQYSYHSLLKPQYGFLQ